MDETQLIEVFRSFDKHGTGRIGRDEFRDLCKQYGIEPAESDAAFEEFDRNRDGQVSLDDFAWGFQNYFNESKSSSEKMNARDAETETQGPITDRRRSENRDTWSQLVDKIGEPVVYKFLSSRKTLEELYQEMQNFGSPPELVTQFEKAVSSLLQDVKRLHDDHQKLEQVFNKEKEMHLVRLKGLEEELDEQVAKVEAEAREEARLKFEQEKKEMMERMEAEKNELQTHLRLFQKVNTILTQKKENNSVLKHSAAFENDKLRSLLSETKTNLAVVHAEMAQVKSEYETKCRELDSHQEVVFQYMDQHKHVRRQLALLQEANKNLQDTNDGLLSVMETTSGRITPYCRSRTGSDSDSITSEKGFMFSPSNRASASAPVSKQNSFTTKQLLVRRGSYIEQNEIGAQYVIQRLMEDIDSGHSTLRDPVECDSDHKSFQEELSDAESAMKSIESDESKYSRVSLRKRFAKRSDRLSLTPSANFSFEATGEPDRTFKVVLAGDAAVGKSCFIHRFCKGTFVNRLGSTLGVDFQIKSLRVDEKNVALQLWDTAGQERFRSMTKTYFRRADGIILLYDVTNEKTFLNIRQWIQSIYETTDKEIPILICGNKVDLREESKYLGENCVGTNHGEDLAKENNAMFYETSSKSGKHIFDSLIAITREMLLREDVEVQTSALQIQQTNATNLLCCGKK